MLTLAMIEQALAAVRAGDQQLYFGRAFRDAVDALASRLAERREIDAETAAEIRDRARAYLDAYATRLRVADLP